MLRAEARRAQIALNFLTRLPLPAPANWPSDALARAARYFPAVGLVVAGLSAAIWATALAIGLPPLPAAFLTIAAQVMLTGGLHEDGLADLADGLGGGATRERALEIMRDSRIGSYGGLALILSLSLRATALAALATPQAGAAALLVAGALSRAAMVGTLAALDYARPEGLASGARDITTREVIPALLTGFAAALLLGGVAALIGALLAWIWITWRLRARLGGYTGDGLGATQQIVEITSLLSLGAAWG